MAEPLPALRPVSRKVPMIIGCALCMELIDSTVVMTALPQMASDFGAPSVRMNLVVSLYMLAAALCVPVSGWAADRINKNRCKESDIKTGGFPHKSRNKYNDA